MKNFNYGSIDYLTVVRKLLDDTVWTTIQKRYDSFDKWGNQGTIAHDCEWFQALFDGGFYTIDGTDSTFHNPKLIKFLDNYTPILIQPYEEAIKSDKQIIVQMSLHPRTTDCDCIYTDYFVKLFKDFPKLLEKMKNSEAHLLLFFGWEADNFADNGTKKGKFKSYYEMFEKVIHDFQLPHESIIILNSNQRGYEQEREYYQDNYDGYTNVIYENAFELNSFKSMKGSWNPTYTFDEHIENLKKPNTKKCLRINRTQLGCRDVMLYWLEKNNLKKDCIIEHRADEIYNDSFFQKEINPWLEQDEPEEYDYYALKYYLEQCRDIANNLNYFELLPTLEYDEDVIKKIKNNSPYVASSHEIFGGFEGIYSNETIPVDVYYKTMFSWVSTSLTDRFDQVFINASTFNPILHYHPLVFNSNPAHKKHFTMCGYKPYNWFTEDEIVDSAKTPHERMVLNISEIKRLMEMPKDDFINLLIENRESLEYNRKVLFECRSIENIIKKIFVIINRKFIDTETGMFKELM